MLLVLLALSVLSIFDIVKISYIITGGLAAGILLYAHDILQKKHSILRNYPVLGRLRFIFESEGPKIKQYFVENDINGTPINKEKRSDIYQKAKQEVNTVPFGTQLDVYATHHECFEPSMYPIDHKTMVEPRFLIGTKFCKHPYLASVVNLSGMSFGALSGVAITALNGGAKLGNFFHNTGEGGLSTYHESGGGDIVFQIGTGYFGCGKTIDGVRYFDEEVFKENALKPQVKMVEIKISQGAKPGHGSVLPAAKHSQEIATTRHTTAGTDLVTNPFHTSFNSAKTLLEFITKVRELCDYKPVGFKMCLGSVRQFEELAVEMSKTGIYPDFITIDGSEGGTGAAPLVFANHMGTPLIDALIRINKVLKGYELREHIRIIAAGKASTSFDVLKLLALGADGVNMARAFLMSLGCIQARECNMNTCPVGIATQDKELQKGLDPTEKRVRVYNFHKNLIKEMKELMGAMGIDSVSKLNASMLQIRNENGVLESYEVNKQI
jgi:glutamate synthase domain-containing protein 2